LSDAGGEEQVLGGEWGAIVPRGAALDLPRRLHAAVGEDAPQTVIGGWDGLGETWGDRDAADGDIRQAGVDHVLDLADAGDATRAGGVDRGVQGPRIAADGD